LSNLLPLFWVGEEKICQPTPPAHPQRTTMDLPKEKRWFPLESNPTLLNNYISSLGFSNERYGFADLYSTDEWALNMIQPPVLALVVLFPMSSKILERRHEMHKEVETEIAMEFGSLNRG
jgi:hypothetical protein